MDTLKLDSPLTTNEPRVLPDPRLKPGRYQVQLVVTGRQGQSVPATLRLEVIDPTR